MAFNAGTGIVRLTANTKGLSGATAAARFGLKGITVAAVAAAAAVTAAFVIISLAVRRTIVDLDNLAKTADKLGIATDKLSELQFAAKLTGVEVRQLNLGLQRMTRRIAEAGQGTGEAVSALRELGLNAADLSRQSPDEQFLRIAEAMSKVTNASDRVRLGFKLFDSEGVGLINTLALGREGLEEMAKQARRLGVSISAIDAQKIEDANDAMTKMKALLQGLVNVITIELAPFITELAERLIDAADSGDGLRTVLEGLFESATLGANAFLQQLVDLRIEILKLRIATKTGTTGFLNTILNEGKTLEGSPFGGRGESDIVRQAEDDLFELNNQLDALTAKGPAAKAAINEFFAAVRARREGSTAKGGANLSLAGLGGSASKASTGGGSFESAVDAFRRIQLSAVKVKSPEIRLAEQQLAETKQVKQIVQQQLTEQQKQTGSLKRATPKLTR